MTRLFYLGRDKDKRNSAFCVGECSGSSRVVRRHDEGVLYGFKGLATSRTECFTKDTIAGTAVVYGWLEKGGPPYLVRWKDHGDILATARGLDLR